MNSFNQITKASIMRKLRLLLPTLLILSLVPYVLNSITVSYINQFINRKAMFLFCNAILLFIARDSGLLLPPSVTNLNDEIVTIKGSETRPRNDVSEVKEAISITVIPDKLVSEQSITTSIVVEENHTESSLELVAVEEASEELEITSDAFVSQNPDPSCIHNVNGIERIEEDLEVDEFNRRCEEFIEKIKRARQMEIGRRIAIK